MKLLEQSKPLAMVWYIILTALIGYAIYKWMKDYFSPLCDIPEPPRYSILGHFPYFIKYPNTIELIVEWGKQFKDYGFYKFDGGVGKISFLDLSNSIVRPPIIALKILFTMMARLLVCLKSQFVSLHYPHLFGHVLG